MKKVYILFISIILFCSSVWSQGLKTPKDILQEKKEAILKQQNIKEAHMFRELYRDEDTLVSKLISSYYDKNGNKVKVMTGVNSIMHNELKYDADNKLNQTRFYKNDSLIAYINYQWENGKIVEERHFHKDTLWSITEYQYYDEADTSFSISIRNKKDTVSIEKLYHTDDQLVVYENLSYPNSIKNYQKWFYDRDGNLLKDIYVNNNSRMQREITSWYGEDLYLIKQEENDRIHTIKTQVENDLAMELLYFNEEGKKVTRMYMEYVRWD